MLRAYLEERTDVRGHDECWPWLASIGSHGYGQGWHGGEVRTSHSMWHELSTGKRLVGRKADDLTIHHTCHIKPCCNPSHFEVITNRENSRMNGQIVQTHCSVCGNEYAGRDKNKVPRCRRCNNRRNRAFYNRKKESTMTSVKAPTKAEIAREERANKSLKSIRADAADIEKLQKKIARIQTRMGKTAMTARKNGVKFSAIADAADRSVAWVQTALKSAGYEPRSYVKTSD